MRTFDSIRNFVPFYRAMMKRSPKRRKHIILDEKEITRCHSMIWMKVKEHFMEDEGGVYIDNIGYLCHMINRTRNIYLTPFKKRLVNRETNGYLYDHVCYDFHPRNQYYHLAFFNPIVERCKAMMKEGLRYKFLYREVTSERSVFGEKWIFHL